MADPQSAKAVGAGDGTDHEVGLLDQIVREGRFGAEPAARERGKDLIKEFVAPVPRREHDDRPRRGDDDQRPHRADRSPGLDPVERDHAPPVVPEAGKHLARREVSHGSERDRHDAQDPDPERAARRNCSRICSARRNSIRARCSRRSTRRSTASSAARLSARWWATTNSASIRKIWNCSKGSRMWPPRPTRRSARRPRRTCSTCRAGPSLDAPARPRQGLRHHRVRQVEELPPVGGFPLRGALPAARPEPAALRQRHQAGRGVQLRRARGWQRSLQVPVDERRVRSGHAG